MRPQDQKIPVVLILYNRLNETLLTLAKIRAYRPKVLYLIADGPKDESDNLVCQAVRDHLTIDWPCQFVKIFSNKNLGLRRRVVTGLTEVFKHEKWAIILEDDCLADLSFFHYASILLKKYASNEKIFSIAGFNGLPNFKINSSYTFSRYVESWGWATWSRAWKKYDDNFKGWESLKLTSWLKTYLGSSILASYWTTVFDLTSHEKLRSWAYRWEYSAWRSRGLTIVPKYNLIDNIGFGLKATNTKRKIWVPSAKSLDFPLIHPKHVKINEKRDREVGHQLVWNISSIYLLIKSAFLKIWSQS